MSVLLSFAAMAQEQVEIVNADVLEFDENLGNGA